MAYCNENIAVKYEGQSRVAVSLKCKSWTCSDCAKGRKRQLIAQGIGGAPTSFLTLTYRVRPNITPNKAALDLSRAWRLTRLRLMRKYKVKRLPFLAVVEKTQAGWPHLHILLRTRYLKQAFISACMKEIADSPIVHIVKLNGSKKAAVYCAKYCSKATQKFDTAKRYWQSRDYDLRDPQNDPQQGKERGGWEIQAQTLRKFVDHWETVGGTVEWISINKAICKPIDWFS